MRVLVVEDEPRIASIVEDYLRAAGYEVVTASDGVRALDMARERRPDLVILDLGIPRLDGISVARSLRRDSDVPIIMLTARVAEEDRLRGLDVGADDYVTKPFSPRELVARVKAVLRRAHKVLDDVFTVHGLTFDLPRMSVTRDDHRLDLTTTEFQLLVTMARHPGRVFTRAQLLDVAGSAKGGESFDRVIDAHVKNIRRKIGADAIATVYGIGYRFAES